MGKRRANGGKRWQNTDSLTLTLVLKKILLPVLILPFLLTSSPAAEEVSGGDNWKHFGLLYDRYPSVSTSASRTEVLGPLFGWETTDAASLFRFSPFFSLYKDSLIPRTEFELAYPILSFDKFGKEYRFHIFQLISWAGGESLRGGDKKRTTIFPIYFQQRATDPAENYTAVVPFYGHLKNRLFRDEIYFVMLPIYLQTVKRGVTTYNYLFPLFHRREGAGVKGWQFWPLMGRERKEITTRTNHWGDVELIGGHEKFSALWPIFFKNTLGLGTTNVAKQLVVLPFYASLEASNRETKMHGFPLGYTRTVDRERGYVEHGAPWPLVVFARGPGKQVNRVWPIFGQAKNPTLQSDFYAWPIYKYNRITTELLDRERTRILLFLYSDLKERDRTNHTALLRRDFWPLFTWRKDHQNHERLQVLALLEPLLPNNKSIERVYSPAYALWRSEKNPVTGASSKSLLWNLYREEKRGERSKHVALFGLFQREKTAERTKWRIFFVPFTTRARSMDEGDQVARQ
jgi:hypothetical protein